MKAMRILLAQEEWDREFHEEDSTAWLTLYFWKDTKQVACQHSIFNIQLSWGFDSTSFVSPCEICHQVEKFHRKRVSETARGTKVSLDWSEGNRGGGQEEEGACKEGEVEPQPEAEWGGLAESSGFAENLELPVMTTTWRWMRKAMTTRKEPAVCSVLSIVSFPHPPASR